MRLLLPNSVQHANNLALRHHNLPYTKLTQDAHGLTVLSCQRRFYGLVSSGARKTGRIETGTRSPVLTHLDQELTDNPYRSKRKGSATSVPSPG